MHMILNWIDKYSANTVEFPNEVKMTRIGILPLSWYQDELSQIIH